MLFAVTDIETTGGYASAGGITEVAVHIYDGNNVIESFETLINPHREIPHFITSLTGITNEMVQNAPSFEEIAPKLYDLLHGKIFVAHSVNFDYSFINHQLKSLNYHLTCKKLCTVRYSRKLFPKLHSYSLGKLCSHFGIAIENRHRAGGDAKATVLLLEHLLKNDINNHLHTMLGKQSKEHFLPLYLNKEDVDSLPLYPGVYYFHDEKDRIVYVGKAKQLKKRVVSHFSNNKATKQKQEFLRTIHRISYQQCGTELMASVLETIEIKRLWPKYNRAIKGFEPSYGLYTYEDAKGYIRLVIDRKKKNLKALHTFNNKYEGTALIKKMVQDFNLCSKLCFIDISEATTCQDELCGGACSGKLSVQKYNSKVEKAVLSLQQSLPTFAIRERAEHEKKDCCILMEEGRFYGMGYLPHNETIHSLEEVRKKLQPYPEYEFIRNIIRNYAEQQPAKVIWL
jgi:DNA polymerase III subunit epsilon